MSLGHKLSIQGKGTRAVNYSVHLDDKRLDATLLGLSMKLGEPIKATFEVFINELDVTKGEDQAQAVALSAHMGRGIVGRACGTGTEVSY